MRPESFDIDLLSEVKNLLFDKDPTVVANVVIALEEIEVFHSMIFLSSNLFFALFQKSLLSFQNFFFLFFSLLSLFLFNEFFEKIQEEGVELTPDLAVHLLNTIDEAGQWEREC